MFLRFPFPNLATLGRRVRPRAWEGRRSDQRSWLSLLPRRL
ncbi:hypothetical protein M2410_003550 [Stenotrophomonas chelatiphaga]|nr:hypothetical protein [Stenotrophomonas chelatiphaga]